MSLAEGGPNVQMLCKVAEQLEWLLDRLVFVGGATTELLVTEKSKMGIRPTKDVDVIVKATSRLDYHELESSLRAHGHSPRAKAGDPICRWLIGEIAVDLMPVKTEILGFSNKWYPEAVENWFLSALTERLEIRVITAPYFLATKLEAFLGRGEGNYLNSHDIEDIIMVLNGRSELVEEVRNSGSELKKYLSEQFISFLNDESYSDAILWNLPSDSANQGRYPLIVQRIQKIIAAANG